MKQVLEDLLHEHEAVLAALLVLERIASTLEAGQPASKSDIQDFLGFFKEFADKCHHGKEEDILFPAMIGAGVRDWGGPISAMMDDHHMSRKLVYQMEDAINHSMDGPRLAGAAREYIALLREHIRKENQVLFPMAQFLLNEHQFESLAVRFEEHEEMVIGSGRHEELHALLAGLEQKYPA